MQAKTLASNVALWDAINGNKTGKTIPANTIFEYLVKNGSWLQTTSGTWVNCGNANQYAIVISTAPPPPPPPPTGTSATIEMTVNSDVAASVYGDGVLLGKFKVIKIADVKQ